MEAGEKDIIDYLKGCPGTFVSAKEIARKAGGREQFDEDRGWAIPILTELVRRSILEKNDLSCYRLKPEPPKKKHREHQISPQILKILKSSGKSFDGVVLDDEVTEKSKASAIPAYRKPFVPSTPDGGE